MVKRLHLFLLAIFFISSNALAAQFTASVDRKQTTLSQSITLKLTLSDTAAIRTPNLTELSKDFTLSSQQQASSTTLINGDLSTKTIWYITLFAKKTGTLSIPAISIATESGSMTSQPLTVVVSQGSPVKAKNHKAISVKANLDKHNPYQGETIVYTIRLISRDALINIKFDSLEISDAIVTKAGEPIVRNSMHNGEIDRIIEIHYLITPLKSGAITIPRLTIQGKHVLKRGPQRSNDPFTRWRNFNPLQPFASGNLKPFVVTSDKATLKVQPPIPRIQPWLPAKQLRISEDWDPSQALQVGEPLTRALTINAQGILVSQLPNLEGQQVQGDTIKLYANQPVIEQKIRNKNIHSRRQETYTLVPQQAGPVTLPAIDIPWWDVNNNQLRHARIPARHLHIRPAPQTTNSTGLTLQTNFGANNPPPVQAKVPTSRLPSADISDQSWRALMLIITGLVIILLILLYWLLRLHKSVKILTGLRAASCPNMKSSKQKKQPPHISDKQLAAVTTARELQHFLQIYANTHWHTPANASLNAIFNSAKMQCQIISQDEIDAIIGALNDVLYANGNIAIETIKERVANVLQKMQRHKKEMTTQKEQLSDLNPS